MLDYKGWHYERDEETLVVKSGVQGDDLPIQFLIVVNAEKELVQFLSKLPFSVREEKRVDLAVAICIANNGMFVRLRYGRRQYYIPFNQQFPCRKRVDFGSVRLYDYGFRNDD